ncbi:hypothetical protein SCLCIDRAFT_96929, partial [Scleroderma citrinum Foug A]
KVLPHGVPELLHNCPGDYGALDFKVMIDCDAIEHVCKLYINSAHAVFNLIPPRFGTYLDDCYEQILCPSVDRHTVWTVYLHLLDEIHQCTEALSILK